MAFGNGSSVFQSFLKSALGAGQTADVLPAAWAGLQVDALRVALYSNLNTPDKTASIATIGYNTGQWVAANQVGAIDTTNWPAIGNLLAVAAGGHRTLTASAGVVKFDADDTSHTGTVTFTDVRGALLYDDAVTAGTGGVADLGVSFHSFGGQVAVTAGTFTVVWNASGLFTLTVS